MKPEPRIQILRSDLESAEAEHLLPRGTAPLLWQHLTALAAGREAIRGAPRFGLTNILYYFGGMLAIGAATLFMTMGFQQLGPGGLLAISLGYIAACIVASRRLDARGLEVPAGIVATLAVCLVPLATWALQHALGWWPDGGTDSYAKYHTRIDWRWLWLELATLASAAVALWRLRYPFLMMPVAFTLWYMSMDLARLLVEPGSTDSWTFYRDFSMWFGLAIALLGLWIDARSRGPGGSRRDYAFWPYLLGVLTFWAALTARKSGHELDKLLYLSLNVGFIALSALLMRRVFAVCGGLGVAFYLGDLSHRLFRDSLLFPLALTAIGFAVIGAGIWWQRHEPRLQLALRRRLPVAMHGWLPAAE